MINLSNDFYNNLAERVAIETGNDTYINPLVILGDYDGIRYRFILSAYIVRNKKNSIKDVRSFWFELHTFNGDEETANDFAMDKFREAIMWRGGEVDKRKRTGWINIYKGEYFPFTETTIFTSKEEAQDEGIMEDDYMTTIKIEWEE